MHFDLNFLLVIYCWGNLNLVRFQTSSLAVNNLPSQTFCSVNKCSVKEVWLLYVSGNRQASNFLTVDKVNVNIWRWNRCDEKGRFDIFYDLDTIRDILFNFKIFLFVWKCTLSWFCKAGFLALNQLTWRTRSSIQI